MATVIVAIDESKFAENALKCKYVSDIRNVNGLSLNLMSL